jgi:hypothetical protein
MGGYNLKKESRCIKYNVGNREGKDEEEKSEVSKLYDA